MDTSRPPRGEWFATTRWTVVQQAGHRSSPESSRALEELCRTYWFPLYAYIRRTGRCREDAEDLTQSFLSEFLRSPALEGLAAERGRFRAYLLACLKHFLANDWDRAQRQKRGGGVAHLPLDWEEADERFHQLPPDTASPEASFDREWALSLLRTVIGKLGTEADAQGRSTLFQYAKRFLTLGTDPISYAEVAARAGIEEGAFRVAVHRLRKRYREMLRSEIAETLSDPRFAEDEFRSLLAALRKGH